MASSETSIGFDTVISILENNNGNSNLSQLLENTFFFLMLTSRKNRGICFFCAIMNAPAFACLFGPLGPSGVIKKKLFLSIANTSAITSFPLFEDEPRTNL